MSEEEQEIIKNELLESLMNSDIEESLEFGTLLLNSENIPEKEREKYVKEAISRYLKEDKLLTTAAINNIIKAYGEIMKNPVKDRVKKL